MFGISPQKIKSKTNRVFLPEEDYHPTSLTAKALILSIDSLNLSIFQIESFAIETLRRQKGRNAQPGQTKGT
jgi:hypothetical protein